MLRKTKEYWQKKAQDDYLQAENDEQRQMAIDMNQAAWKKRVDESRWLLKNAPTEGVFSDASLKENLDKHARRKYVDMDLDDNLKTKQKKKKKRRGIHAWRHNLVVLMRLKNGDDKGLNDEDGEDNDKKLSKFELEQKRKAVLAKQMREEDERKERERVLQANVDRIKVLERVVKTLKRPRLPKHHRPVQEMVGYVPDETEVSEEVKEINAYGLVRPKIPRPVEELKSVQQIMKEDNEANLHHVPERYHRFLGLEKIYPLKAFPATLKALFSGPPPPDKIPENLLLPQGLPKSKTEMEVETEIMQRKMALSKIKRHQLDMSRLQFRIPQEEAAVNTTSLSPSNENVKISQQFLFNTKEFVDANSVHEYPHPPVNFTTKQKLPLPSISSTDSVTIPTITTGLQYDYLPSSNNSSIGSDRNGQPMGSGPMQSRLLTESEEYSSLQAPYDYNSEYAVRSNYHSQQSTRCDPIIPVRMERLRTVKKLTNYHVKGNFHVISRRKKEKILAEKAFAEEG